MLWFGQLKKIRHAQLDIVAAMEAQQALAGSDKVSAMKAGLQAVIIHYLQIFNSVNANAKVLRYLQQYTQRDDINEADIGSMLDAAARELEAQNSDKLLRLLDIVRAYHNGMALYDIRQWINNADNDSKVSLPVVIGAGRRHAVYASIPLANEEANPLVESQPLTHNAERAAEFSELKHVHAAYLHKLNTFYHFKSWRQKSKAKLGVADDALRCAIQCLYYSLAAVIPWFTNPFSETSIILSDLSDAIDVNGDIDGLVQELRGCRQRLISEGKTELRGFMDIAVAFIDGLKSEADILQHIEASEEQANINDDNAKMRQGKLAYTALQRQVVKRSIFAKMPEVEINAIRPLVADDYPTMPGEDIPMKSLVGGVQG